MSEIKMIYNTPPSLEKLDSYDVWERFGLASGNGGIGVSVMGGVQRERINLNEKSLWSGGPSLSRPEYNGGNIVEKGQYGKVLKEVQNLFLQGEIDKAIELCNENLVGAREGYGYYLNYGNMYFDFDYADSLCENYKRMLDLSTGIISVEYDVKGIRYIRETFTSYPDNVIVTNIKAIGGALGFKLSVVPDNSAGEDTSKGGCNTDYTRTYITNVCNDAIIIKGTLDDNGLNFSSVSKVITDGKIKSNDKTLDVVDAAEAMIITTIGTDYKNVYPNYRTGESLEAVFERVQSYVNCASEKTFDQLKRSHLEDYNALFGRVNFTLTEKIPVKPLDILLRDYNDNVASQSEKLYLETLMFQFGRYLAVEGSRETPKNDPKRVTLPTNLQGMWVGANNSCWHSDYHFNINIQMNYWPVYVTNMPETAEPLIDYVESLRVPGRITASVYAGITSDENNNNGFMVHTQNTPYGWTCPGYCFSWGWSMSAVAWILQNCYEHFEYTGNVEYLREKIYPMLKETSIMFDNFLTEDKDGDLVSSPAYSPEHGPYTCGNTYEHSLLWQLYEDTVTAANLLGVDAEKVKIWKENQKRLKGPIEIGEDGQIKEWYNETTLGSCDNFQPHHRHLSNLVGLFPGKYITSETPGYFDAAKISLAERGDAKTGWKSASGWSMSWRALCYARMGEGQKAYDLIDYAAEKTCPNLFQLYPPFQIDGVFGYTAAVAEMLVQSNAGFINLLPAIPNEWKDGKVSGLLVRGNFVVSVIWKNSELESASLLSQNGGKVTINYKGISAKKVIDKNGNILSLEKLSENRISLETVKGETYTII